VIVAVAVAVAAVDVAAVDVAGVHIFAHCQRCATEWRPRLVRIFFYFSLFFIFC